MASQGMYTGSIRVGKGGKWMTLYTCPCCGYRTLEQPPPGTYAICVLCDWEDDAVQYEDVDYAGGANTLSLRTAQRNFQHRELGCAQQHLYKKDKAWRPLPALRHDGHFSDC